MIFVKIKNDRDLLVQVGNFLAEKAADFNTVYGDVQINSADAWVITNTQASASDMGHVLYIGAEADCPEGAVCVSCVEDTATYIADELADTKLPLDLGRLFDLGDFDPIDCVYDLIGQMNEQLPKDDTPVFDKTLEEMQAEDNPEEAEPIQVEIIQPEDVSVPEEPEIPVYEEPEPEEVEEPVQEPEPVQVEIVEEPVRRMPIKEPVSREPHIVQRPDASDEALVATGVTSRSVRRKSRVQQAMDKSTPAPLGRAGRVRTRRDSGITRRIYVVTGTSPSCGISSFCFSLASALSKSTYEKTLLVDMDVLKPTLTRKLTDLYDLDMDSDDTIDNFATMHLDDLLTNVEYLTSQIAPSGGGHFAFIRGSALSFKNRKVLCNMDYTETFDMLSEVYTNIVLDLGVYNGAHPYQDSLINNHYCTIVLLDCSSVDTARESVDIASQIGEDYKAILSKCDNRVNPFKIQNTLHRPVLGKILSRTSAADIWRTGDPFGTIKEATFRDDWELLVDEVKRM